MLFYKFLTDKQNLPFGQPKPVFKRVSFMEASLLVVFEKSLAVVLAGLKLAI